MWERGSMRNYQRMSNGCFIRKTDERYQGSAGLRKDAETRSRLVIDDNSIYEIDLDCCENRNNKKNRI